MAQLGARFHGMEEVTGSIPVRSTNQFNNIAEPPSNSLAAIWQQISKCLRPSFAILLRSSLLGRSGPLKIQDRSVSSPSAL